MAEIGRRRRPSVPALVGLADVDDLGPIVGGRQLFEELVDDCVRVVVVPVEFVPKVLSISRRSRDIIDYVIERIRLSQSVELVPRLRVDFSGRPVGDIDAAPLQIAVPLDQPAVQWIVQ